MYARMMVTAPYRIAGTGTKVTETEDKLLSLLYTSCCFLCFRDIVLPFNFHDLLKMIETSALVLSIVYFITPWGDNPNAILPCTTMAFLFMHLCIILDFVS